MKKTILLITLVFTFGSTFAQKDSFDCLIRESLGDLNGDSLDDRVIISMDTTDPIRPLRLQIFFSQKEGSSILFYSSTEIIEAMYPAELKGKRNGSQVPDVTIKEGKLRIDFYIKGNSSYHFVFREGEFELVHFTYVHWDGKHITETEFNLLTGKYTKLKEIIYTSEVIENLEKTVLITPLPVLKDFKPFEHELY